MGARMSHKSNDSSFNGTCRELMRIDMVSGIHGEIIAIRKQTGRRGYGQLYIGVGDGGCTENGYAFLTHHPINLGSILELINGDEQQNGPVWNTGKSIPKSKDTTTSARFMLTDSEIPIASPGQTRASCSQQILVRRVLRPLTLF